MGERWELALYSFNYNKKAENPVKSRFSAIYLMFLSGFEPLAFRLGGGRSILLSYRNMVSGALPDHYLLYS